MVIKDSRLAAHLHIWTSIAPGMGQLQPDQEIVDCSATLLMGRDEHFTQPRYLTLGVFIEQQLIGVGASFMPHGDCFSAPDQLGAAQPKILPASECAGTGTSLSRRIPA